MTFRLWEEFKIIRIFELQREDNEGTAEDKEKDECWVSKISNFNWKMDLINRIFQFSNHSTVRNSNKNSGAGETLCSSALAGECLAVIFTVRLTFDMFIWKTLLTLFYLVSRHYSVCRQQVQHYGWCYLVILVWKDWCRHSLIFCSPYLEAANDRQPNDSRMKSPQLLLPWKTSSLSSLRMPSSSMPNGKLE